MMNTIESEWMSSRWPPIISARDNERESGGYNKSRCRRRRRRRFEHCAKTIHSLQITNSPTLLLLSINVGLVINLRPLPRKTLKRLSSFRPTGSEPLCMRECFAQPPERLDNSCRESGPQIAQADTAWAVCVLLALHGLSERVEQGAKQHTCAHCVPLRVATSLVTVPAVALIYKMRRRHVVATCNLLLRLERSLGAIAHKHRRGPKTCLLAPFRHRHQHRQTGTPPEEEW